MLVREPNGMKSLNAVIQYCQNVKRLVKLFTNELKLLIGLTIIFTDESDEVNGPAFHIRSSHK